MKKNWLVILLMSFMLGLLSGCNQLNDLLETVNSFIGEDESEDDDAEVAGVQSDDNQDEEAQGDTDDAELDSEADDVDVKEAGTQGGGTATFEMPFDELLVSQGYEIRTLPNGFPFQVPYHWILVESNDDEWGAQSFEGKFCFKYPLEVETIADRFAYPFAQVNHEHYGVGNDIIHTTTFVVDPDFLAWDVTLDYHLDAHDNTCVSYNIPVDEGMIYGEDPSTMVSEEELKMMGEWEDDTVEPRSRNLVSDYDDLLSFHSEDHGAAYLDIDPDDIHSINDRIYQGNLDVIDFEHGLPVIFPYEWYLLEENIAPDASWSGRFCTDAQVRGTIMKHQMMLAELEADITEFYVNESPSMNLKAKTEFAFNDIYGTGSWQGNSIIYIDQHQEYEGHKCADVQMNFSSDLLN